ncbi:hypothetical protein V6N12_015391 [Hibiscus sabdariffa]|uniref:Protein yippee-like n=1 Tax=Hibiscus sabdariffa TaxID=183260 RepID=A0ABR2DN36_9ROSI
MADKATFHKAAAQSIHHFLCKECDTQILDADRVVYIPTRRRMMDFDHMVSGALCHPSRVMNVVYGNSFGTHLGRLVMLVNCNGCNTQLGEEFVSCLPGQSMNKLNRWDGHLLTALHLNGIALELD